MLEDGAPNRPRQSVRRMLTITGGTLCGLNRRPVSRPSKSMSCPTSPRSPKGARPPWQGAVELEDSSGLTSRSSGSASTDGMSDSGAQDASSYREAMGAAHETPLGVKDTHGCIAPMNPSRAAAILRNFRFYKEMDVGMQEKLPTIANRAVFPAGTVLFRQGDPPANCYVLLSGEIAVCVVEDQPDEPSSPENAAKLVGPTRRFSIAGGARLLRSTSLSALEDRPQDGVLEATCTRTVEGFSFYHENSALGKEVARLKAGTLLGELALMNDDKRSGSTKCMEECECLVIKKGDFDRVLKEEMNRSKVERLAFLQEHLPGMREVQVTRGKPHASYFFRHETFPKGHTFLRQGVASEESIYVVWRGSVEFRRREPASCGATRPHFPGNNGQAVSSRSRPTSAKLPRVGEEPSSPTGLASGSLSPVSDVVRKLVVLMPGGVFGSLPAIGEPEPFTVAAASGSAEVLYVSGDTINKLPRRLLETIREYLTRATTWRLEKLRSNRAADVRRAEALLAPLTRDETPPTPALGSSSSSPALDRSTKKLAQTWPPGLSPSRTKESDKLCKSRCHHASALQQIEVPVPRTQRSTPSIESRPLSAIRAARCGRPTSGGPARSGRLQTAALVAVGQQHS